LDDRVDITDFFVFQKPDDPRKSVLITVEELVIENASVSFGNEIQITTAGEYSFYTELRGDPFFGDPIGLKITCSGQGRIILPL